MCYVVKDVRLLLGTFVTITVTHRDPAEARLAICAAFDEIQRLQRLLSVHDESSELSQLNRTGCCEHPSDDTINVIATAQRISEQSGGAFDISVLPLQKLWAEALAREGTPAAEALRACLHLVDYRNIEVNQAAIRFRTVGMAVTTAGIAKGYAVDQAIEILRQRGIKHALVNAGGDIRALGGKRPGVPWRVIIRDGRGARIPTVFNLVDGAIASSGAYSRPNKDTIDPRSGRLVEASVGATAIAPTAIEADAFATAFYVLGKQASLEMIAKLSDVNGIVTTNDGKVWNLSNSCSYAEHHQAISEDSYGRENTEVCC